MSKRILVTRPEPGAARTAETLAELGFRPIVLPLTRIDPVDDPEVEEGPFAAVAVTSVNALHHAPVELLRSLANLPCFAVGRETAHAASEAGFNSIVTGPGNADGLAELVVEQAPKGSKIAYLCGRLRRRNFEDTVRQAGLRLSAIETYATRSLGYTADQLFAELGDESIGFALLYSVEAALALARILHESGRQNLLKGTRFICLSSRIASVIAGSGRVTSIAEEPTEASLISRLRDISSVES